MEIYQYAAEFQAWRELDVVFLHHNLSLSCDLEKRDMTLGQENDTTFDYNKTFVQSLMKIYPLALEEKIICAYLMTSNKRYPVWPLVKVLTHFYVIKNDCAKIDGNLYPDSWIARKLPICLAGNPKNKLSFINMLMI